MLDALLAVSQLVLKRDLPVENVRFDMDVCVSMAFSESHPFLPHPSSLHLPNHPKFQPKKYQATDRKCIAKAHRNPKTFFLPWADSFLLGIVIPLTLFFFVLADNIYPHTITLHLIPFLLSLLLSPSLFVTSVFLFYFLYFLRPCFVHLFCLSPSSSI